MVSFIYQNTNYYALPTADGQSLLAFDAGWPCSRHEYARAMKATGFRFEQIRWAMVSHFHLDHAGLIGDFQDIGIQCLLFENQGGGIDEMERIIRPKYKGYKAIHREKFLKLQTGESRAFFSSLGIFAEVIQTPGHSDDSVSLVSDSREALIGDLYPVSQIMADDVLSLQSWKKLRESGGRHIFPSHAKPFELDL